MMCANEMKGDPNGEFFQPYNDFRTRVDALRGLGVREPEEAHEAIRSVEWIADAFWQFTCDFGGEDNCGLTASEAQVLLGILERKLDSLKEWEGVELDKARGALAMCCGFALLMLYVMQNWYSRFACDIEQD